MWLVILGLAIAAGVQGYYLMEWDKRIDARAHEVEVETLRDELARIENDLRDLGPVIAALEREPDFDPSALQREIRFLKSDVRFLSNQTDDILSLMAIGGGGSGAGVAGGSVFGASVSAEDIEKPFLCSRGDLVLWDFQGLTC